MQQLTEQETLFLRALSYRDYLTTEYWKKRRKRAVRRAGSKCQLCGWKPVSGSAAFRQFEVHHNCYEHRGCEKDHDLIVLCPECHAKHHDKWIVPVELMTSRELFEAAKEVETIIKELLDSYLFGDFLSFAVFERYLNKLDFSLSIGQWIMRHSVIAEDWYQEDRNTGYDGIVSDIKMGYVKMKYNLWYERLPG